MSDQALDKLIIEVDAKASGAQRQLARLSENLTALSGALAGVNISQLSTLAASISNLSVAMNSVRDIRRDQFTRLADSLNRLTMLNTEGLANVSTAITGLITSLGGISSLATQADTLTNLARSMGSLGGVKIERAVTNLPLLANSLRDFMQVMSTAPTVNANIINMVNALANLASQGSRIQTASNSLTTAMARSSSAMTKTSHKSLSLASIFGKLYASYFLLIRGVKAFYGTLEDTSDFIESYNYMAVSFNKIAKDWGKQYKQYGYENAEAYGASFQKRLNESFTKMSGLKVNEIGNRIIETGIKNLGLSLKDLEQYSAGIASITNAMGMTGEASLATSEAVVKLAADLGSLKNVDYGTVAENLQSGLVGQSRVLYKYGIDITQATLETYAFNLGIKKSVAEMTQGEKAQLRLIAILDQSKVAWGDLANTINTPSNQLRQLKNNAQELGTVVGQLFMPMLDNILPKINGITIAIKTLAINLAEFLGIEIDLTSFGSTTSDALESIGDDSETAAKNLDKVNNGIRAFDKLNVISSKKSVDVSATQDTLDLTNELLKATDEYNKVWSEAYEKMNVKAQAFADTILEKLTPVSDFFEDLFNGDGYELGEDVTKLALAIFNYISDALEAVDWYELGVKVGKFFAGIDWIAVLGGLGDVIFTAISAVLKLWDGIFDGSPVAEAVAKGIIASVAVMKLTGFDESVNTAVSNVLNSEKFKGAVKGAATVGVGIALIVDSIKEFSEADIKDTNAKIGPMIESLIGSAVAGLGVFKLATTLGASSLAGGIIGVVTFTIGAAISWIFLNKEQQAKWDDYLSGIRETGEEAKDSVEDFRKSAKSNVDSVELASNKIEDLAKKVFELSQNYDLLTEGEKKLLGYYSDELVNLMPDIADKIDLVSGAYKGTWEELQKVIDKTKEYVRLNAYTGNLQEAANTKAGLEKTAYEQQKELEGLRKPLDDAFFEMRDELEQMWIAYWPDIQKIFGYNSFEEYVKGAINFNRKAANNIDPIWGEPLGSKYYGGDAGIDYGKLLLEYEAYQDALLGTQSAIEDINQDIAYWEGQIGSWLLPEIEVGVTYTVDEEDIKGKAKKAEEIYLAGISAQLEEDRGKANVAKVFVAETEKNTSKIQKQSRKAEKIYLEGLDDKFDADKGKGDTDKPFISTNHKDGNITKYANDAADTFTGAASKKIKSDTTIAKAISEKFVNNPYIINDIAKFADAVIDYFEEEIDNNLTGKAAHDAKKSLELYMKSDYSGLDGLMEEVKQGTYEKINKSSVTYSYPTTSSPSNTTGQQALQGGYAKNTTTASNTTQKTEVVVTIKADENQFFNAMVDKSNDYYNSTGKSAFAFS